MSCLRLLVRFPRAAIPVHHIRAARTPSGSMLMERSTNVAADQEEDQVPVHVEVVLRPNSTAIPADIGNHVLSLIQSRTLINYVNGPLDLGAAEDPVLASHVEEVQLTDADPDLQQRYKVLLRWQVVPQVSVVQLHEDGPEEEDEGEEGAPASYKEWQLPNREFHTLWETLYYDVAIKRKLLKYASSALLFSDYQVNPHLISWNRVVLLHGPPGTGKTSLCRALAQKLSIALSHRYRRGQLVEVNAHSLFSKWFSESGKLVSKLFSAILEFVEEEDTLVFVLIDEVESLTSARKAAVSGSEPSDAIRAVNALLTQLDGLKRYPNVMVLTTRNITEAIDAAFVDRADIKAYIGPPSLQARYEILRGSVTELGRAGIIAGGGSWQLIPYHDLCLQPTTHTITLPLGGIPNSSNRCDMEADTPGGPTTEQLSKALLEAAQACEGLSGRALRKLPFLAHATSAQLSTPCTCLAFLKALRQAAERERSDRQELEG